MDPLLLDWDMRGTHGAEGTEVEAASHLRVTVPILDSVSSFTRCSEFQGNLEMCTVICHHPVLMGSTRLIFLGQSTNISYAKCTGGQFFFFNMKHLMNLHVILMLKPR